jgi:SAM-dependent methyltransferase
MVSAKHEKRGAPVTVEEQAPESEAPFPMHTNPFATEAAEYAHLRPTYPDDLFSFLSTVVAFRDVAWDCATGNGQAATHLARYFERVIATDESAEMIAQAPRDPKIEYRVAEAEDSGLEEGSIDLVTVASAIHWFDLDRFYSEVRRVVKPGGVVAAWTYYTPVFGDDIDTIIKHLAQQVLKDYWDKRLHYVVDEFHDLPFPFEPIEAPPYRTDMRWTMEDLLGYFETWSSSVKYREAKGTHPTDLIKADVARVWGDPRQKRDLHFPLYMRLGRV